MCNTNEALAADDAKKDIIEVEGTWIEESMENGHDDGPILEDDNPYWRN